MLEKSTEIRNNCGNLRLLQHRLADKHVIWVRQAIVACRGARHSPRQIATIFVVPREQLAGESVPRPKHAGKILLSSCNRTMQWDTVHLRLEGEPETEFWLRRPAHIPEAGRSS